jgi:hypothetical protein
MRNILDALFPARRRAAFIRDYEFPAELDRRLAAEHPEWSPTQRRQVLDGLREFFLACLAARQRRRGEPLGMPSKAVDEAWHAFILMTREYTSFCVHAFGRYLHHTPEGSMSSPMVDALANTVRNLRTAGIGGVPLLFAIDHALGLAPRPTTYEDLELLEQQHRNRMAPATCAGYNGACATIVSSASPCPAHAGHGGDGGHGGASHGCSAAGCSGSCGGGGGCGSS